MQSISNIERPRRWRNRVGRSCWTSYNSRTSKLIFYATKSTERGRPRRAQAKGTAHNIFITIKTEQTTKVGPFEEQCYKKTTNDTRKIPRLSMHPYYIIPTPIASSRLTRIDPSLLLVPCDLVVGGGELT
jgi:hypothetical protein